MSELPCVGAGITVVDPGPNTNDLFKKRPDGRPYTPKRKKSSRASWHEPPIRLLKAYVVGAGPQIIWKCGIREGLVSTLEEGTTWTRGHGPQACGALLAQRALEHAR